MPVYLGRERTLPGITMQQLAAIRARCDGGKRALGPLRARRVRHLRSLLPGRLTLSLCLFEASDERGVRDS